MPSKRDFHAKWGISSDWSATKQDTSLKHRKFFLILELFQEDDYPDSVFDTSDNGDVEVSFQAEEPSSTKKYPQGKVFLPGFFMRVFRRFFAESQTYSSLTEYKWSQLGTRDRVSQARKIYMEQKDAGAVKKTSEGICLTHI